MLILRFKRAECALADGRLDEAYRLAAAEEMRAHRRGQDLADRLARALTQRGQEHLRAARLDAAASDCEKASVLAGNLVEIAALRDGVASAIRAAHQEEQRKALALADARKQVANGQLSVGQGMLAPAQNDTRAMVLKDEIDARRLAAEAFVKRVSEAVERSDWEGAIRELARAGDVKDARLSQLAEQVTRKIVPQVSESLTAGRLDQAGLVLGRLARVGGDRIAVEELRRCLALCQAAWEATENARYSEAAEVLRRLQGVLPAAKWIGQTLEQIEAARKACGELRCGPLSLLAPGAATLGYSAAPRQPMPALPKMAAPVSPRRLTLHVDGVGGFLILMGSPIRIGPMRSSGGLDLPLAAGPDAREMMIERVEDDYFLRSAGATAVNDRPTSRKLLVNGDRISASSKARLTFRLPSPASTTAVLDLSGARLPIGDVSRVILLDRELILGPGANAHVRDDQMPEAIMLCQHNGMLVARSKSPVLAEGQAIGAMEPIPLGAHVRVGDAGFVIMETKLA